MVSWIISRLVVWVRAAGARGGVGRWRGPSSVVPRGPRPRAGLWRWRQCRPAGPHAWEGAAGGRAPSGVAAASDGRVRAGCCGPRAVPRWGRLSPARRSASRRHRHPRGSARHCGRGRCRASRGAEGSVLLLGWSSAPFTPRTPPTRPWRRKT